MADTLSKLKPARGARKTMLRVGRGIGSGIGKTCGRGVKGYRARAGSGALLGFEGGQMPQQRRMPKRGFFNHFAKTWTVIDLADLERWALDAVSPGVLVEKGLVRKIGKDGLRVLGSGKLGRAVKVEAHHFSAQAAEKIAQAGGKVVVIAPVSQGRQAAAGAAGAAQGK